MKTARHRGWREGKEDTSSTARYSITVACKAGRVTVRWPRTNTVESYQRWALDKQIGNEKHSQEKIISKGFAPGMHANC